MIVKDEAKIIERCLAAAAPHIDSWAICDTGSSDSTVELIEEFFRQRGIPGVLARTTFRNFEQARNEALAVAEQSAVPADYLLLCDADMELVVEDPDFRSGLSEDAYSLLQRMSTGGLEYSNIRLLRRGLGARYKGVTHEYIDTGGPAAPLLRDPFFIDHAAGSSRSVKYERDIGLLLQGLSEQPDNARYVFYLAQSYRDSGRLQDARNTYMMRIALGGWAEEVWYSMLQVGLLGERLGLDEAQVVHELLAAHQFRPSRAEALYHLARFHRERGQRYSLARLFAEQASRIPRPDDHLFVDRDVYAWRIQDELAISSYWTGDFLQSEKSSRAVLANPELPKEHVPRISSNLDFAVEKLSPKIAVQSPAARTTAAPYGDAFYANQMEGSARSAEVMLRALAELYVPASVADVGCGRGTWLAAWKALGVTDLHAIDGSWNDASKMVSDAIVFHQADLNKGIQLPRRFDLAMSLEVAEHCLPASSEVFHRSLTQLADAVIFGAAFTGQPGTDHINCRPHSFWADMFRAAGYETYDFFRPRFWGNEKVAPWYQQNTFLYVRPGHELQTALLRAVHVPMANPAFVVAVHPWLYSFRRQSG